MLKIAKWYNNFQAPVVLMIDDLSDAYIDVYNERYKNDWGYFCTKEESSYSFLKKELLDKFPDIKITFFTPYARHNVINENSKFTYKKYPVGERLEFTKFLKYLVSHGHEIAHHGSNHGQYIDESKPTTVNNWIHEWALFDDVDEGVRITLKGVQVFKEVCNINVVGGKYCGYTTRDNSAEIIDKCNFLYWCDKPSYSIGLPEEDFFGKNNIISFPTNFAGNSFVRLSYLSGNIDRDKKKVILKYFQPLYNLYSYIKLYKLYRKGHILSIQEHNSPSTTAGTVQSANIVTDIVSLNKIFYFLKNKSIWYETAKEIAEYIYVRENAIVKLTKNKLNITFINKKNIKAPILSLTSQVPFKLINLDQSMSSIKNNGLYVVNVLLENETSEYDIAVN